MKKKKIEKQGEKKTGPKDEISMNVLITKLQTSLTASLFWWLSWSKMMMNRREFFRCLFQGSNVLHFLPFPKVWSSTSSQARFLCPCESGQGAPQLKSPILWPDRWPLCSAKITQTKKSGNRPYSDFFFLCEKNQLKKNLPIGVNGP